MKKLGEEVAYLKGLAEGLEIDEKSKEGKMIGKIIEVLANFAEKVNDLEYDVEDLQDQVEEMEYDVENLQQDVEDLEEWLYDEEEDDDYDEEYDEYDDYDEEDDEEYDDEDFAYIEMKCPNCSEEIEIDEELLFDETLDVICPNCHAVILSSEEDYDEEGCGGDCGCSCCDDGDCEC